MAVWNRRDLLKRAAGLTAAATLLRTRSAAQAMHHASMQRAPINQAAHTLDASQLQPFVDLLPMPVLQAPIGVRSSEAHGAVNAPCYRVTMRPITHKLHRDLPSTQLYSYGDTSAPILIETRSGKGVLIDWVNQLPAKHFLPLDPPMRGMHDAPETRTSTHLHGARVPSISDGHPDDWFGPGNSRLCFYPNLQDAAALWMHDHAMGTSRFNIFAGLMGCYLIRDDKEDALNLPSGPYELPLFIYDRSVTLQGQLFYPNPPDDAAWTQEYSGDAIVVNGKITPFHPVEPRLYRLRITNTSNARFFSIAFSNGAVFHVIGSDQGLLQVPVQATRIVLAPAERIDILVDFAPARGDNVQLISDHLNLMQFRVAATPAQAKARIPARLRTVAPLAEAQAARTRVMTLNEFDGDNGDPMVMLLNRKHWTDPVTEIATLDSTEVWTFLNLTSDVHPIHLHMVRFQILDRQPFAQYDYLDGDQLRTTGQRTQPAPHERGWKDVVQCPPFTITRIIVSFAGYTGRYLWHCHILEHEANDMMRPLHVIA